MGTRDHATWAVSATLVFFAAEGFQHYAGETVAHSLGAPAGAIFAGTSIAIGYIWSVFFEGAEKPKKEEKPKPRAPAKPRKRKP